MEKNIIFGVINLDSYVKPMISDRLPNGNLPVAVPYPIIAGVGFLTALAGDDVFHPEHMLALKEREEYVSQ